jgi:hypothetical protein
MNGYLTLTFHAGTDIGEACREATRIASQLNLDVAFTFNEVWCCARPGCDVDAMVREYSEVLGSHSTYKILYGQVKA